MSLLEALLALMILGFSVVGYLDLFRGGATSVSSASDWMRTVAIAESAMEAATLGDALQAQQAGGVPEEGFVRRVEVRPWDGALSDVVVTVTSPQGASLTLHRLVRSGRLAAGMSR